MYKPSWMNTWIMLAVQLGLDYMGQPNGYGYTTVKGRIVYGDKIISAGDLGVLSSSRAEVYLAKKPVLDWLETTGYDLDSITGFAEVSADMGTGTDGSASELDDLVEADWIDNPNVFQRKEALFNRSRGYIYLAQSGTN